MRYGFKLSANETEVQVANGVWEIIREEHGHRWVTSIELETTRQDFSGEDQIAIDAEVLHGALQVEGSVKRWITKITRENGYFEGRDYERYRKDSGKRGDYRYNISLHMARDLAAACDSERGKLVRFSIEYLQNKLLPQRHYKRIFRVLFDAYERNEIFDMWKWNKEYLDFDPDKRMRQQLAQGQISLEDANFQQQINNRIAL